MKQWKWLQFGLLPINNSTLIHLYTIEFVGYYRKIDLTKTMDAKMNGLQINCPKNVAWFFFLFLSFFHRKIMNEKYFEF